MGVRSKILRFLFTLKQYAKMVIQNLYLPYIYKKACKTGIKKGRILFADAHSDQITDSMLPIYHRLLAAGYDVKNYCVDLQTMSAGKTISYMRHFMQEYATAEYVFISSYFLPVSSCQKRDGTTVVQLWHSGGLMKKMGYDTAEDIPEYYRGNITANYDLVTVSAECCVSVWENALHLPAGTAAATGLARTDIYFDQAWNQSNTDIFYKKYPQAKGKKICVYAPSFEGNAAHPYNRGLMSGILNVMKKFEDEWFFIIKLHPHMEKEYPEYYCEIKTQELFAVTDLLITDYSSVVYDYLVYRRPFLLYAPDLEEYKRERGFYIEYESLPAPVVTSASDLEHVMEQRTWNQYVEQLEACYKKYMGACDGHAAERILRMVGLDKVKN